MDHFFDSKVIRDAKAELEAAERDATRAAHMRRSAAQADALRVMADLSCPETVKEFGERHGIKTFAEFCWISAFEAGYSAGLSRLKERATAHPHPAAECPEPPPSS